MLAPGVHRLEPGGRLRVARETPVVCIPVYGAHELFVECLRSVLRHTSTHVPIVIADDASPDPASAEFVASLEGELQHAVWYLRQAENRGFGENVNSVFDAAAPGDVVILNSDCVVGPEWLDRLRAAAYSASTIATATPLTNNGTILSVPRRNRSQPSPSDLDEAVDLVAHASLRLRPRIPTAIGHCMYVRRMALDLVGGFDPAFSPGYGEEVDFSQRCVLRGLTHVAADDVFILHHGKASFGTSSRQEKHEQLLAHRYPYYHLVVDDAARRETGPLARALAIAARALTGLSVTIDARCLGPTITGTQVHTLELIHALARTEEVRLRVIVPPDVGDVPRRSLEKLDEVEVIRSDEISEDMQKTQVVHRPYQVFHVSDLPLLPALGTRIVITHQDLISFRNPGYARSGFDWLELHRLTRVMLALADVVAFFSRDAADDALAEGLIDDAHATVVHLGVDHQAFGAQTESTRPSALPGTVDDGFLLCLGTDFRHKNRVFALQLVDELRERHAWDGWLVFAGPHAASGTSAEEERKQLARQPELRRRTVDLGAVADEEKRWLLEQASGVIYPSIYEGFGLIPFEAAEAGTPCFFAAQTALAELLPPATATLVPWDAAASADAIAEVLRDPERANALATAAAAAGSRLIWDRTATEIVRLYEQAVARPHRELTVAVDGTGGVWNVLHAGGAGALERLPIPFDVYRGLLAILARPFLARPFFAALRVFFRTGYFMRHGRLPKGLP